MTTWKTAALAATLLAGYAIPAAAQIPVIDPVQIARVREIVATASQSLAAAQKQVSQFKQMSSTIGAIGQGQIGAIMQASGLNFSGVSGILNDVRSVSGQMNSIAGQVSNFNGLSAAGITQASQSFAGARQMTSQLFYLQTAAPTNQSSQALHYVRGVAVREAGMSGYGLAMTIKGDMTRAQETADRLSAQAAASADLRTDVQANTAAVMALYAQITKETAISAQMLEIQAAQTLAMDATLVHSVPR